MNKNNAADFYLFTKYSFNVNLFIVFYQRLFIFAYIIKLK